MATLSQALQAVSEGQSVRRPSWLKDDWHVEVVPPSVTTARCDILARVTDEGWEPWGVINSADFGAEDYELADGNTINHSGSPDAGSLAWAVEALKNGDAVRRSGWKDHQKVFVSEGALLMMLPNGKASVPYVFAPGEHVADDFEIV
jgi:hypothetical protein